MRDLEAILHRIDERGYKAYKEIEGRCFRFENFDLLVEHVQGDPYAAPSKLRALVPVETAALPATALASPARRRATRDFLARAFRAASGRHREIAIDAGRQTVLDRSACLIDAEAVELRFTIDLPGDGRRVLGRKAASLLVDLLPGIIDRSALARDLDLEALEHHAAVVEDQEALRAALVDADLANNTMGWQWVAGTGADAAPYFRVFNPVTQAEKFDPQARYISRWVPELAALPVKARFAPWQHPLLLAAHAPDYPRTPLVDLAVGRDAALAAYRQTGTG